MGKYHVSTADAQRSGLSCTSAKHVEEIDAAVQADRCASCMALTDIKSFTQYHT
jgi:hypothetical protein